jgi:UPF0042 nucleotide-binding protein
MQFLVITGRSGSGKSSALHLLEDEGYTCIDNIPVSLLPELIVHVNKNTEQKFAIGIDARNIDRDLGKISETLSSSLLLTDHYKVIYLDTHKDILLKRFSETRRKHPLSNETTGLDEAIEKERQILAPMFDLADIVLDTSALNLHELRSTIKRLVISEDSMGMAIMFSSFGFKFGTPIDADFIFDVRSLPNPHWEAGLKLKTGLEPEVIDFLDKQTPIQEMVDDIATFITKWIPSFERNNRSYLTIAIGCTGGMHRSVYICERLAARLKRDFKNVQARHRQLSK